MRSIPTLVLIATSALALVTPVNAQSPSAKSVAVLADQVRESFQIAQLVEAFTKAQHDFDQAQLRALTADDYVEISPIGEVDPRDKMLGFYDPAKKVDAPPMTVGERSVRKIGDDTAIVVTTISYTLPAKDGPRTVSMRAVFVAHRERRTWKLVSAQYTPIRSKS